MMQLPQGCVPGKTAVAAAVLAASLLLEAGARPAAAQGKLEAHYRVSLLGVPIGTGAWVVDLGDDAYMMTASGHTSGLLNAFSSGEGAAAVKGTVQGTRVVPTGYAINIKSRSKLDAVRMALAGGAVRQLSVEPPVDPSPHMVPLTETHKRGITDPISMGVIPAAGPNGLAPEACDRRLQVFDGRIRFDLALSFKRTEKVKAQGYEGPALVCAASFQPLGGHEPERAAIRFLRESRDIEIWYAPIAGTRFLAMYRINVPTLMGTAVLEANRFVAGARSARPGTANAKTQ